VTGLADLSAAPWAPLMQELNVRRATIFFLTAVFLIALLSFTIMYTVRFTEAAVVTTFGKADEHDVRKDPGLYVKWPYPIQSVTTYDTRTRVLTTKLEQVATADSRQVVVESFCTWRVKDPLKFFRRWSNAGQRAEDHYRKAEDALRNNLRAVGGLVSRYRMDELFSATKGGSKLPELEGKMLAAFQSSTDQTGVKLDDYGIEAVDVGITRIVLTEEVTKAVFERMIKSRELVAKTTEAQGQAQAASIRSKADADTERIKQFAGGLAQKIKNQGDLEATPYLKQMSGNSELARFETMMDFIREVYGKRTTLVVAGSMPGMWMLQPDALDAVRSGQIPPLTKPGTPAKQKAASSEPETSGERVSSPAGSRP
jgi:membrane protease subunit HflC